MRQISIDPQIGGPLTDSVTPEKPPSLSFSFRYGNITAPINS